MLVDFDKLPEESRVWIYQANRSFSKEELEEINSRLRTFLEAWTAHGKDLQAGYSFKYKRFIVIGLNQNLNNATGCSIDASVHFIQELERDYKVDLMDKMNVSFKVGEHINIVKLNEFRAFAKSEKINAKTLVFNNMIATKRQLEEQWEVPAEQSWHKKFLV